MNIEEKAQAYDEALEQAKKELRTDLHESGVWALKRIFPELADSEDERIRKEIIDYLGLVGKGKGDYAQPMIDRWIAYLEKQKEQKPAEWSEEDEKMRRNLMSLLTNMRGDRITEETYQKYYPWLKDLHPSWKPSKEQMDSLQQEQESVAERFARIVRGNLIGIDKEVQQKFEQLYFEVTGNKMYRGYND